MRTTNNELQKLLDSGVTMEDYYRDKIQQEIDSEANKLSHNVLYPKGLVEREPLHMIGKATPFSTQLLLHNLKEHADSVGSRSRLMDNGSFFMHAYIISQHENPKVTIAEFEKKHDLAEAWLVLRKVDKPYLSDVPSKVQINKKRYILDTNGFPCYSRNGRIRQLVSVEQLFELIDSWEDDYNEFVLWVQQEKFMDEKVLECGFEEWLPKTKRRHTDLALVPMDWTTEPAADMLTEFAGSWQSDSLHSQPNQASLSPQVQQPHQALEIPHDIDALSMDLSETGISLDSISATMFDSISHAPPLFRCTSSQTF